MKMFQTLFSGLGNALRPALDGVNLPALKPGETSAAQVRQRMGEPAMEWQDDDGTQTWEYPRTPEGVVNYMIVIGANGLLREVRQVLCGENFARVQPGMSRDEVRRLLGQPAHTLHFARKKEHVWDWKTQSDPGMDVYFNVHFDEAGVVLRTSSNFAPLP